VNAVEERWIAGERSGTPTGAISENVRTWSDKTKSVTFLVFPHVMPWRSFILFIYLFFRVNYKLVYIFLAGVGAFPLTIRTRLTMKKAERAKLRLPQLYFNVKI